VRAGGARDGARLERLDVKTCRADRKGLHGLSSGQPAAGHDRRGPALRALAYVISGTAALIREIAAGNPVIVLQNLSLSWAPVWHYAVAIGYDIPADEIVLHTGLNAGERTSMGIFQNTWARAENWGLLVLKPSQLPATAKETLWVEAALGLERAQQPAAAVESYHAALSRWPQNLSAMMGLGNSYYALGTWKARRRRSACH